MSKVNHLGADQLRKALFQFQLFLVRVVLIKFRLRFHLLRVVLNHLSICIQYLHYPPLQFLNTHLALMVLTLRLKLISQQLLDLPISLIGRPMELTRVR